MRLAAGVAVHVKSAVAFVGRPLAEGRGVGAGDGHAGEALGEGGAEFFEGGFLAAK